MDESKRVVLQCTCPKDLWIGSEPNDSTCELTEEEHEQLAARINQQRHEESEYEPKICRKCKMTGGHAITCSEYEDQ